MEAVFIIIICVFCGILSAFLYKYLEKENEQNQDQ